jgi:hypothetical protein
MSDQVGTGLSDEDIGTVLGLLGDADSVELKLNVSDTKRWEVVEALDIDPLDAQIRQVFFFDTPDLALNQAGLVVRARRVQGKGDDTVVKLRPVVPSTLPPRLRRSEDFVVEIDTMPGSFVCSASFKGALAEPLVRPTVQGNHPVHKLFSKAQRDFYAEHAPEGVGLDDLTVMGPIMVFKLKVTPPDLQRRVVGEMWVYPDGSRIVELSTKCTPSEPFQVAAEVKAFLAKRGISMRDEQRTKTRAALDFFTGDRGGAQAG